MPDDDDAENARAALRALWAASGQLGNAESLGQEQYTGGGHASEDVVSANADGKGGLGGNFGSNRHEEVGFSGYLETNEPTFDRGEAASKFREAWKSELTKDGKLGGDIQGKSIAETAHETTERVAAGEELKPEEKGQLPRIEA